MEKVGVRIRRLRKERGLTQDQLATKAQMQRTDINRAENNGLTLGAVRLQRIADALDVSVLELRPESQPDPRGMGILDRLEALAEADVEIQANQHKALLVQEQMLGELKAIREALETSRSGQTAAPKRKAQ